MTRTTSLPSDGPGKTSAGATGPIRDREVARPCLAASAGSDRQDGAASAHHAPARLRHQPWLRGVGLHDHLPDDLMAGPLIQISPRDLEALKRLAERERTESLAIRHRQKSANAKGTRAA